MIPQDRLFALTHTACEREICAPVPPDIKCAILLVSLGSYTIRQFIPRPRFTRILSSQQ